LDEYQVPLSISLHLAGLQAQADYGNYDVNKTFRYNNNNNNNNK